jgi:hypothetical protein
MKSDDLITPDAPSPIHLGSFMDHLKIIRLKTINCSALKFDLDSSAPATNACHETYGITGEFLSDHLKPVAAPRPDAND